MAKAKPAPAEFTGTRPDSDHLPSLRELDEADGILQGFLAESEGEVTPEIEGLDEWLKEATVAKFLKWGYWLRARYAEIEWLVGQAAPFKTEFDRIIARKNALDHAVEWSETRLIEAMRVRDLEFVQSPLLTVKRIRNTPFAAKNGEPLKDDAVAPDVLEKLFDNEETRHLIKYTPASYTLDKNAVKVAVAAKTLPQVLVDLGIGTGRGERIDIR